MYTSFRQLFFFLFLFNTVLISAQENDPVLFTVDKFPVNVSEFKYIYEKTNGAKADYSEASVNEYLQLYKKFKLKVRKAQAMRLDTVPSLQKELEGYRKQLANSYLIDREVTEKLIQEAYDRSWMDVNISHIMAMIPANPKPADTLAAYEKITAAYQQLKEGKAFDIVAKALSDDKTAAQNGGNIGHITAMLPDGFYSMESAAYTTKEGDFSAPIRTAAGYHIIKVNKRRTARGEMEAAHILIRKIKDKSKSDNSKMRIDSVYNALQAGANFEDLAKKVSQDKGSASKGGNIGSFGINRYEGAFEDAAFGLKKDGDMTGPVETTIGWHIIKRINKTQVQPYKIARGRLQNKIKRDGRYNIAKKAMVERIKNENNYTLSDKALNRFIRGLDDTFLSYKWKPAQDDVKRVIFTLGDASFSQNDFITYLEKSSRQRLRLGRTSDINTTAMTLFDSWVDEAVLTYEERQLEKKYPEFKSLMREYEEGILLFEATKILVWDKASQDSVGLAAYFDKLKGRGKYMWDDRAKVSFITLKSDKAALMPKIQELCKKKSTKEVLAKYNKKEEILSTRTEIIEKGKNKVLDAMTWKAGEQSAIETSKRDQSLNFLHIEEVIPPTEKTLDEARGYIIADYQDYLEKNWVQELAQEYPIVINEEVLKSLIKK